MWQISDARRSIPGPDAEWRNELRKTFEVVDNFYRNPGAVRERALLGTWTVTDARDEPRSPARVSRTSVAGDQAVDRILGLVTRGESSPSDTAVSTCFTLLPAEAPASGLACPPGASWTALVWLSLPEDCRGGLSFRRVGKEGAAAQQTAFVDAKFNRAVVFAAESGPHVDGPGFGDGPETARLAQWLHLTMDPVQLEERHA